MEYGFAAKISYTENAQDQWRQFFGLATIGYDMLYLIDRRSENHVFGPNLSSTVSRRDHSFR